MPRIELLNVPLYGPDDPIHWQYDNLPLKALMQRQELINLALDDVIEEMRDAIGTQGSVANRLNQSIEADGSLKTTAIDDAEHSIESHTDTENYVRMTKSQSDKLDLIDSEATDVSLSVDTGTEIVNFSSGIVKFQSTDSITLEVEDPNIIKMELGFPIAAAHRHYYGLTPVDDDLGDPDYINYKVNSSATPYIEDSLRIYINGVRIFSDDKVYVPGALVDDPWTLIKYTPNHETGKFTLSSAIDEADIIRIDFDIPFV